MISYPDLRGKPICEECAQKKLFEIYSRWFDSAPCFACQKPTPERTNGISHIDEVRA
jgi:hypothetical protein